MAKELKRDERLVCVGQTALRAPDGTPLPSVPMYIIVDKAAVNPKTGLTEGEAEMNGDIAAVLAPMFKQYMDGIKQLEQGKRGKKALAPVGAV